MIIWNTINKASSQYIEVSTLLTYQQSQQILYSKSIIMTMMRENKFAENQSIFCWEIGNVWFCFWLFCVISSKKKTVE